MENPFFLVIFDTSNLNSMIIDKVYLNLRYAILVHTVDFSYVLADCVADMTEKYKFEENCIIFFEVRLQLHWAILGLNG